MLHVVQLHVHHAQLIHMHQEQEILLVQAVEQHIPLQLVLLLILIAGELDINEDMIKEKKE